MSRVVMILTTAVAAIVALGGLTSCQPAPVADTYVSLGDSMVAGPMVPEQIAEAGGCFRSTQNYPHLIAPTLHVSRFVDVSCSGAILAHLDHAQGLPEGSSAPPQLDAVTAQAKVITIGLGANDIGFSDVVQTCYTRMLSLQTCTSNYVRDGRDIMGERIDALGVELDRVYPLIRQKAPQAEVFVVPYFTMLPDGAGCAPDSPFDADLPYLRSIETRLHAMLKAKALAAGFRYLDSVRAATAGHDMCKPAGTKWVEGLIPSSIATPFHPNAAGYAGIAPVLTAAINAAVPA